MSLFFAFTNLFVIAGLAYQIWRKLSAPSRIIFWPALLFKLTAGICLGFIYMYYYDGVGDTILYFHDATVLSSLARKDPMAYLTYLWESNAQLQLLSDVASQPRALFLLKLSSAFNLLSHDNYWITSIYFSFISFLTAWYLVKQVEQTIAPAYWPAVVGFLFFPTAVFWSAGLIKESLAMAGLYLISGIYIRIWFGLHLRRWEVVLLSFAVWIVWSLKYYFLGALIPIAVASLIMHRGWTMGLKATRLTTKVLLWVIVMLMPLAVVSWLHPNFRPHMLMQVIVDSYRTFHTISNPEDLIYYSDLRPDLFSLMVQAPKAAACALFRPVLWEASNILQLIAAVENLLLLLLTATTVLNFRNLAGSPYRLLIITVVLYTLVLATFLALSAPNFGTLSRYRVGFLPFFVTVLLACNPFVYRLFGALQRYPPGLGR